MNAPSPFRGPSMLVTACKGCGCGLVIDPHTEPEFCAECLPFVCDEMPYHFMRGEDDYARQRAWAASNR